MQSPCSRRPAGGSVESRWRVCRGPAGRGRHQQAATRRAGVWTGTKAPARPPLKAQPCSAKCGGSMAAASVTAIRHGGSRPHATRTRRRLRATRECVHTRPTKKGVSLSLLRGRYASHDGSNVVTPLWHAHVGLPRGLGIKRVAAGPACAMRFAARAPLQPETTRPAGSWPRAEDEISRGGAWAVGWAPIRSVWPCRSREPAVSGLFSI